MHREGAKSSSLKPVSELCYFVCPDPGSKGCLVRSFKSNDLFSTYHLQQLDPLEVVRMVAARHALNSGLMRESTGMAEVKSSVVAAETLRLLQERADSGLSQNLDDLVVILDGLTGQARICVD